MYPRELSGGLGRFPPGTSEAEPISGSICAPHLTWQATIPVRTNEALEQHTMVEMRYIFMAMMCCYLIGPSYDSEST